MATMKTIAVAISALFLFVESIVLHAWQIFFMAAALFTLPIISYVLARRAIGSLRCSREAPEYAQENEPIRVSLLVQGHSRLLGPVEIHDTLPEWIEPMSEEAHDPIRDTSDGLAVFRMARPVKRGEYHLGPVAVRASDPLGFFRFAQNHQVLSRLVVYPSPLHIPELDARLGGEFGEHQFEGAGAKGSGIDFHGVREYHVGDELRRVHWRSTARHGRLNVIEFEHSVGQDAVIAVDLKKGSEVGTPPFTSLEYAVKLAADVAEQALSRGSSVHLTCAGLTGRATIPDVGARQYYAVLEALAGLRANRKESLPDVLTGQLDLIERNTVVICLASDIDDRIFGCAELLNARSVGLIYILINLSETLSPDLESRISDLMASGVEVLVVDCSPHETMAELRYNYAD